jgi:hypothetical protein
MSFAQKSYDEEGNKYAAWKKKKKKKEIHYNYLG